MPRPPQEWSFGYTDLQECCELTLENLYQFRTRQDFDPENFESVVLFVARHGKLDLRRRMVDYMLTRELTEKPGAPKKQQRRKK
jgi:hypothetical protein